MSLANPPIDTNRTEPLILELISELEKRDKATKGAVQSGTAVGAGLGDPRGFTVLNTTGHDIGTVRDLYVDPTTRLPEFALLSLGNKPLGIGDRQILVAYTAVEVVGEKQVKVHITGN